MSFDTRKLTTAGELKAFGHPVRLAIMERLAVEGPMTASELGNALDETPANCSWHLRKLAEHKLVEETNDGSGRRRPWRVVSVGHTWDELEADPATRQAGRAVADRLIEREVARFRHNRSANDDPQWEFGAAQNAVWMTEDEARAWHADLLALMMRHRERIADPDRRPPEARLVHTLALTSVEPEDEH